MRFGRHRAKVNAFLASMEPDCEDELVSTHCRRSDHCLTGAQVRRLWPVSVGNQGVARSRVSVQLIIVAWGVLAGLSACRLIINTWTGRARHPEA